MLPSGSSLAFKRVAVFVHSQALFSGAGSPFVTCTPTCTATSQLLSSVHLSIDQLPAAPLRDLPVTQQRANGGAHTEADVRWPSAPSLVPKGARIPYTSMVSSTLTSL